MTQHANHSQIPTHMRLLAKRTITDHHAPPCHPLTVNSLTPVAKTQFKIKCTRLNTNCNRRLCVVFSRSSNGSRLNCACNNKGHPTGHHINLKIHGWPHVTNRGVTQTSGHPSTNPTTPPKTTTPRAKLIQSAARAKHAQNAAHKNIDTDRARTSCEEREAIPFSRKNQACLPSKNVHRAAPHAHCATH